MRYLVFFLLCFSAIGWAQPTTAPARAKHDDNGLLVLFPDAKTAPAPDWIKPGLRLTYYVAAASSLTAPDLIDEAEGDAQWSTASGSGHGFAQVNVVAVDKDYVVLDVRSYAFTETPGPPIFGGSSGIVGHPGIAADFWIQPAVLRKFADDPSPSVRCGQGPLKLGGRTYQTVRFGNISADETGDVPVVNSSQWVFDRKSGVLLHGATQNSGGGDYDAVTTQRTLSTLVDVRMVDLPWANSAPPKWLAKIKSLTYQGTRHVPAPNAGAVDLPYEAQLRFADRTDRWARFSQTVATRSSGLPPDEQQSDRICGPAQIGGPWIPPDALAALQPNQSIDKDPITRVNTVISKVTPQSVTISEISDIQRTDETYDRASGLLIAFSTSDKTNGTRSQLRLIARD